ncbi:MAG: HAD-IIB family hydrolase [Sideroxyarcus sp.]|nr:HAD-IIB family hydrolase [Sideroxyarcus sp.]
MSKTIIITDLDGTLLDAASYSCAPAQAALDLIRARDIPLILCSSKTRVEIEVLRRELDNHHPFISENGGGVFIPRGYFSAPFDATDAGDYLLITLGTPYAEIRRQFHRLRDALQVRVRGFGDMTVEEVAALTGLSLEAARLARQRDFDEPFVFEGAPDEGFLRAIEAADLSWTEGRLFHIMGRHDKGRAARLLQALYQKQFGTVRSIGLGDSLNDLQMLQAVDQPVLVKHDDGSHDARINIAGLSMTQLPGPSGWNEAVLQLLAAHENGILREMFDAALAAVDPYRAVLRSVQVAGGHLRVAGADYDLAAFERILVVGGGKATARMAQAAETLLGDGIAAGLIVVKDGHTLPLQTIEQVEAAHPVPNAAGEAGARRILDMVRAADDKTLVVCLLSGGASALLVAPAAGLTLQDKQDATGLLLRAGASIDELNAVRKHLSAIKGGRLAQAAHPAQVLTLLLSDVIGDRLDVIASGPTAADGSTFADALAVIAKYSLRDRMPPHVMAYLQQGADGQLDETAKAGERCFAHTRNVIVGALGLALEAAAAASRQLGFNTRIISAELQGEARDAAQWLAQIARTELSEMGEGERRCLLCGGETTVTVRGAGKGGRNQELALAFAQAVEGLDGVMLLSAATDGSDGPTDAAGAQVDGRTAARARAMGLDPQQYLDANDSCTFFRRYDELAGGRSHLVTGPTGTNVMDMQLLLLDKRMLEKRSATTPLS